MSQSHPLPPMSQYGGELLTSLGVDPNLSVKGSSHIQHAIMDIFSSNTLTVAHVHTHECTVYTHVDSILATLYICYDCEKVVEYNAGLFKWLSIQVIKVFVHATPGIQPLHPGILIGRLLFTIQRILPQQSYPPSLSEGWPHPQHYSRIASRPGLAVRIMTTWYQCFYASSILYIKTL